MRHSATKTLLSLLACVAALGCFAETAPLGPEGLRDTGRPDASEDVGRDTAGDVLVDTSARDTSTPDTSMPDTSMPDTSRPDSSRPDSSRPDTSRPDTSMPDTSRPDTSRPDTAVMCDEDPCRLVGPQCGCDDSEACYLENATTRACRSAGTVPEGGSCSDFSAGGRCARGSSCLDFGLFQGCKRSCETSADCEDAALCAWTARPAGDLFCTSPCNVLTNVGCSGDLKCGLLLTREGDWYSDCFGTGARGVESSCDFHSQCGPGLGCIRGQCLTWCSTDGDCSAMRRCDLVATVEGDRFGGCVRR